VEEAAAAALECRLRENAGVWTQLAQREKGRDGGSLMAAVSGGQSDGADRMTGRRGLFPLFPTADCRRLACSLWAQATPAIAGKNLPLIEEHTDRVTIFADPNPVHQNLLP